MVNKKEIYICRIITFFLVAVMFASCFVPTIAYAEEQNVNEEEAKYLAFACVWDVQSGTESFKKEIYYSDVFKLYDSNLNPSAYVVNFVDKNAEPSGYVVIGATSDYSEIIEFSDEGKSPYEEQYTLVSAATKEKVYSFYEGNVSPFCIDKEADNFIEMNKGKIHKSKKVESTVTLKYSVRDRKDKANRVKNMVMASGGSSSELEEGDFPILNPYMYESGYKLCRVRSVDDYEDLTFLKESDYPNAVDICGPLAATNIIIYWKNKDPGKYTAFMKGDNTWNSTFNDLRSRMYLLNTTNVVLFASGVENFMDFYSSNGATVTWNSPNANNWNTVKTEIETYKYPIVLLLQNHIEYGDHYVVAFAYLMFEYPNGTYSNYVRICDGRSATANRYINFTKGFDSGSIYTIMVHPN